VIRKFSFVLVLRLLFLTLSLLELVLMRGSHLCYGECGGIMEST